MKNNKISLALGSGAARGLTHIGVIQELEARGYQIVEIVGTSIGALIGGVYAAGALDKFVDFITQMGPMDFIKLVDPSIGGAGFIKGDKIFELIRNEVLADIDIEQLEIPFTAIAVDINSNKKMVFDRGPLFRAMRSSISIPGVFTPVEFEGKRLVDGALLSPLPLEHLSFKLDTTTVAVNLNGVPEESNVHLAIIEPEEKKQEGKIIPKIKEFIGSRNANRELSQSETLTAAMELMNHRMSELTIEKYNPDIVIDIPYSLCDLHQFYLAKELIKTGRDLAIESFDKYGL